MECRIRRTPAERIRRRPGDGIGSGAVRRVPACGQRPWRDPIERLGDQRRRDRVPVCSVASRLIGTPVNEKTVMASVTSLPASKVGSSWSTIGSGAALALAGCQRWKGREAKDCVRSRRLRLDERQRTVDRAGVHRVRHVVADVERYERSFTGIQESVAIREAGQLRRTGGPQRTSRHRRLLKERRAAHGGFRHRHQW